MRALTPVVLWSVAVVVAIAIGITAVDLVGASLEGRGPLGSQVDRDADRDNEAAAPVDGNAEGIRKTFSGAWGSFEVSCAGVYAVGDRATADRAAGWSVFTFERGPDDDVDAIFTDGRRSIELEVFCNGGEPTVAEMERSRLTEEDSSD